MFIKYLLSQKLQTLKHGFTLVELLVVTIVVSVLAAISLPNFLAQVGKAREAEATSQLGALGRAQQAYHFETQIFASDLDSLDGSITVTDGFYNFPDPSTADSSIVKHQAVANIPYNVSSRNFALGIYHSSGNFSRVLCRAAAPTLTVTAPDANTDPCNNNGIKIE